MDITKAESILEDLKTQQKAAQEQMLLINGAVQGAELVLKSLKENGENPVNNKRDFKRPAK